MTDEHRAFGNTGLRIPPLVFGTSALANARRIIPDQTKIELCGEWFRQVTPPVAIDIAVPCGDGGVPELLARVLQRLDVAAGEVVIVFRISGKDTRIGNDFVRRTLAESCRMLGSDQSPQLAAIDAADDYLAAAQSPTERTRRMLRLHDFYRALEELKSEGNLAGIGVAVKDWRVLQELDSAVHLDWIMLNGSFTIMHHPPQLLAFMSNLAARQTPIICAGIFHCNFLTGGNLVDSGSVNQDNPSDRSMLAWRKAFAAICHGHGITPVQACIQFALSAPGVAAVLVNTSRPERVAENVAATATEVPDGFWASMKEEGLLGPHCSWPL